jgi:hypothetical protein
MVGRQNQEPSSSKARRRPATTPESRENQLVSLAVELAEKQLSNGTASAQVITHYLKLGSSREKLEQERLMHENDLLRVKRQQLESEKRVEELYKNAISAMQTYTGNGPIEMEGGEDAD